MEQDTELRLAWALCFALFLPLILSACGAPRGGGRGGGGGGGGDDDSAAEDDATGDDDDSQGDDDDSQGDDDDSKGDDDGSLGDDDICLPDCVDKECGDDGCGGECGTCPGSEAPTFYLRIDNAGVVSEQYEPVPAASTMIADAVTVATFLYPPTCSPDCGTAVCGDDGCGGSCGACSADEACYSGICAGVGDVSATLEWATDADLDLYVTDPAPETIFYAHPTSASGGELDVDSHANCIDPGTPGVENIFWPQGDAPLGTYQVAVNNYSNCNISSTSYTVTTNVLGAVNTFTGVLSVTGETQNITVLDNTGVCVPSCGGAVCGDDGCGGSCGTCGTNQFCSQGICVGSGVLGITLEWDTVHDLDLVVVDPTGVAINYTNLTAPSGGFLDVDSHADCVGSSSPGVENVYWSVTGAPSGLYTVKVDTYKDCGYVQPPPQTCNEATFQCEEAR